MTTSAPSSLGTLGTGAGLSSSSTTVVQVNANGAPPATVQPPTTRLNPYNDNTAWKTVIIGGVTLPGVVEDVDGCNTPEEWAQQKPTSGNFATSVWKGSKLAESIKIKLKLHTREAFDAAYDVRDALRPRRGVKPPSHVIQNGQANFGGINRVAVKDVGFPKWVEKGGYWSWEIELFEYNPAAATKTGPADPAKDSKDPADANTTVKALQSEVDSLLKKVNAL